ncbi:MAG: imidazole glycerol phosphate synthase subunit HisH [Candidatus Omnitrophica bacterium]|nr:imidazole glycerol phosphate synthase subunit HisH [Candidatus Omnitrophota bacterium]
MDVVVVDYGMGNLGSVRRSLEECGAKVLVSGDPSDLESASRVILPGVGAFADGMAHLRERGWIEALKRNIREAQIPLLGICLGMQLLADKGYEGGQTEGLGLVPGVVKRFEPGEPTVRIPHVGWNEVHITRPNPLFSGIPDNCDFYFVHSYYFVSEDDGSVVATTPFCGGFASAVMEGSVFGVQFHPEKSSRHGFCLLRNFLKV